MKYVALIAAAALVAVLGAALAQDTQYALKDYMPRTVGSTWTLKTADGARTSTLEVLPAQDVGGQQVSALATKTADGAVRMGTFETVDQDAYTVYGQLFGRGPQGGTGEPTVSAYDPPARFPGVFKVLDTAEATYKVTMRDQPTTATMTIELAAVESVTVPKGTFDDCLKIVTTTKVGDRERKTTTWYAKGVGTVKTERAGRDGTLMTSELTDYALFPQP
jgi:hypothetical protein